MTNLKHIRQNIRRFILNHNGRSEQKIQPINAGEIKKIMVVRTNHRLGNMLLVSPLIQELNAIFPQAKIDLFVQGGAAKAIFKNYKCIEIIHILPRKPLKELLEYIKEWVLVEKQSYDLAINVISFSSSGRISTRFIRAKNKFYGDADLEVLCNYPEYRQQAEFAVYASREYFRAAHLSILESPIPLMDLKLSKEELALGKKLVYEVTENTLPIISVFTHATGEKRLSKNWWSRMYKALQDQYPNYGIVEVLPIENISQLDFKAPTYYSKDLREIGAFIANTAIFIGADSGMMHLSSASLTPTIGLFSVTDPEEFGPYGNQSKSVWIEEEDIKSCLQAVKKILG